MKIEKKLVSLSIIALVLGIITVVPIALMPSAAEPPVPQGIQMLSAEEFYERYGTNATEVIAYAAVPATDKDDFVYEEAWVKLIPAEEFYERYGTNATIPDLTFWMFESEPGA
jgi:phosphate uptake regulator